MCEKPLDEEAIFKVAAGIPWEDGCGDYLQQVCGGDDALRNRVLRLLRARDEAPSFLESPASGIAATIDFPPVLERPGQTIGRYKLLEEIGEGGMGVVYMAEQREPVRRKVALKIVKPGTDTREVIVRFEAERQALAMMDHPNIAKVLDGGATESGRPYFVMELVQGIPITDYCDRNNLTTRQRLSLFVLVCRAVQHAHQKGIIHRDLKPSNVMVTLHDGVPVPKIIDFGIAKAIHQPLTEKTFFTGHGRMMGTPMYMSPEQAEMSGLDVDTRSDIYSLGVLLYELLTGSTPFDQERLREAGFDEVRRVIREEEPPRPSHRLSTLNAEAISTITAHRGVDARLLGRLLSGDLDWIVMRALEKDRTRRYESANDFARDIQRHLDNEVVEACPPSTLYRLRKFVRRNRIALATMSLVAVTLLVGSGVATWQAVNAMQAREVAERQQERAERQQERADKNFQRALDAVDQMLTQVADKELANVPQLEPIREKLPEKALAFYQGLQNENDSDHKARHETGLAHRRSGDIQALRGKHDDAEKEFKQAIVILTALVAEFPYIPDYRAGLGEALGNLALYLAGMGRHEEAEKIYGEAILLDKQLVDEFPKVPKYRSGLANDYNNLGVLLGLLHRFDEAEKADRAALAIRQQLAKDYPTIPDYRRELGDTLHNMGVKLVNQGTRRNQEAEEFYRQAQKVYQQLVAEFPAVADYRRRLAILGDNLGLVLKYLNRNQEAEQSFHKAIETIEPLARAANARPDDRRVLYSLRERLGLLLKEVGRNGEAEELLRAVIKDEIALAAEFPAVPEYRQKLVSARINLSNLLWIMHQEPEAVENARAALGMAKKLAADYPIPYNRLVLGRCYYNLGTKLSGKRDEQEMAYREAIAVLEKLVAEHPAPEEYRSQVDSAYHDLAHLLKDSGRLEEARDCWKKQAVVQEALVKDYPGNPDHARTLADVRNELTELDKAITEKKAEALLKSGPAPQASKPAVKEKEKARGKDEG